MTILRSLKKQNTYNDRQKWVNTTEIIHFLRIAKKINENNQINFQKLKLLFITYKMLKQNQQ